VHDDTPAEVPPRLRSLLSDPQVWAVPPPELEDDVLSALRRARSGDDLAAPRSRRRDATVTSADRSRRRWRVVAAAAAGIVVASGAVATVLATRDQPPPVAVVALHPTDLIPGASARAEIRDTPSGFQVELDARDLPPAPTGSYYQAWLKSPAGELVTIGTFHGRDGAEDVVLWSGVDPADYPTLTVTLQPEGAGAESSGRVVLSGSLP
jgi:anti-sigma-K factor RskA